MEAERVGASGADVAVASAGTGAGSGEEMLLPECEGVGEEGGGVEGTRTEGSDSSKGRSGGSCVLVMGSV